MEFIICAVFFVIAFCSFPQSNYDVLSRRMLYFFLIFWCASLCLTTLDLVAEYNIGFYSVVLLIMNVLSFCAGYNALALSADKDCGLIEKGIEKLTDSKLFFCVACIAFAVVVGYVIKFRDYIIAYQSLSMLRDAYFDDATILYGESFNRINAFFLTPFSIISIPTVGYMLIKKRNILCWIILLTLIGYESLGGGRFGYVRILLGIVFIAYCLFNFFKVNIKSVVMASTICLVFLFLIGVVSMSRGSSNDSDSLIGNTYSAVTDYMSGSIAAFDYSINKEYVDKTGGFKYGAMTFSAPIGLLNLIGSRIGIKINMDKYQAVIKIKQEDQISLGKSSSFNALYTAPFWFYQDLGLIGVILYPFFFGLIIKTLIQRMYRRNSYALAIIVCYAFIRMVFSIFDYFFFSAYEFLALCLIFIYDLIFHRK